MLLQEELKKIEKELLLLITEQKQAFAEIDAKMGKIELIRKLEHKEFKLQYFLLNSFNKSFKIAPHHEQLQLLAHKHKVQIMKNHLLSKKFNLMLEKDINWKPKFQEYEDSLKDTYPKYFDKVVVEKRQEKIDYLTIDELRFAPLINRKEKYYDEHELLQIAQQKRIKTFKPARTPLSLIFIGHVDSGKSTICGSVLASMNIVDQLAIQQFKQMAIEQNKENWYYAFMMDTSKEERDRGVTIEVNRVSFLT